MSTNASPLGLVLGGALRIERFLARGGMGEVYEGVNAKTGERVAVKLLLPELMAERERFKREAEAASMIRSPHVARALAWGTSTQLGRPWIAFELLDGESLDVFLKRERRTSFNEASWMIEHLLSGLEAAHERGIIHRDIKPANLFLERNPRRVRILDFGVAKIARPGAATSGLTRLDDRLGTPIYASPEQIRSSKDVDVRTDLYAAGCVGFQLLTGRVPFEHPDPIAMLSLKQSGSLPSLPRASGLSWPPELERWFDRMLAYRREDRFSTAPAALEVWRSAATRMASYEQAPIETSDMPEDTDIAPASRS